MQASAATAPAKNKDRRQSSGASAMAFDRDAFFDLVLISLFGGHLSQGQVDGMNAILYAWER